MKYNKDEKNTNSIRMDALGSGSPDLFDHPPETLKEGMFGFPLRVQSGRPELLTCESGPTMCTAGVIPWDKGTTVARLIVFTHRVHRVHLPGRTLIRSKISIRATAGSTDRLGYGTTDIYWQAGI